MVIYPLAVIHLILSWNIKLFNHLPETLVVTGRPTHWIAGTYNVLLPQIQDIHVCIMPETVVQLCHSSSLMVSYLLLLPWCTAITGYRISNNNSNSQQQPTTGYRQTSKVLPGVSLPITVITTTNKAYVWQFKYVC